ncbi:tape measure protein [Gordonia phage Patio]|uniref:Tape measure protein n=1 Tax=Gordonia phage Patio TaxID=2041515 RepID=A0A2D2W4K5_9CAUD|nr:tail length tape measure protein [Gordonia phage Patio]ATS93124.1 tape measure protein [Gordonia phage Patio]
MAKTFLVGEGAVRLIPNAAGFHVSARKAIREGGGLNVGVDLRPDAKTFRQEARTRLKAIKLTHDVKLRADTTGFARDAKAKLEAHKQLTVRAKVEAHLDARSVASAHTAAQAQLRAMGPLKIAVKAEGNLSSLAAVMAEMQAIARAGITTPVNAERGRSRGGALGGGGGGGGGGRPVRKAAIATGTVFAPIVTQAALGGLTALVGAASQAAGALGLLPAAATAAGAGLAAVAIGAAGIGGAFSALSKESEAAGSAVGQSASAQAGAQRQIAAADRGLATAHRGVTRALQDLNNERRNAVRRLRDMNDEMKMAPVNEREAALAIKESYKRLQEAYASGDALEIEGAQIDIDKSKLQYDQLKKQNSDLAADVAEANRKGVEGDEQVIAAKDGVTDAVNGLKDAQDALASAMEAAADATKSMAGGTDQLAKAMAKLAPNAQDFVRKIHALGPAWTETRKFIQDALFSRLGDSVTTLANVQLPVLKTGLAGIATEINGGLRGALATFSTEQAAMDFTTTLNNSRGMWAGIAQSFAPFAQAFMNVTTVGSEFMPRLGTAVSNMASNFKQFTDEARADGSMQEFFENSLTMAKQLGRILANVGAIVGEVFSAGAEVGGGFLNTIETATGELREFLGSAEGQEGLKTFFEGVKVAVQTLAPIIQIVASTILTVLGPALTDLVIGLGPGLVQMFEGLSGGLAAIQPVMQVVGQAIGSIGTELGSVFEVLGPVIAQVLSALAPAIQPLAQLLGAVIKALAPILVLVGEFVGLLISALAPAFTKIVEALTPVIQSLVDSLMPVLPPIMDVLGQLASTIADALVMALEAIAPFLPQLVGAFGSLLTAILPLMPVFGELIASLIPPLISVLEGIMPTVVRIIEILGDLVGYIVPILIPILRLLAAIVGEVFSWIGSLIGAIFRNVLDPIFIAIGWALRKLGDFFHWLWEVAIKPAWDAIWGAIKWGWENAIKPAFNALMDGIQNVGDFFAEVVSAIGKAWGMLADIASKPINWVINHVINGGIGRAWKAVDNFLGGHMPDWKDVSPIRMASGGEVPMAAGAERGKDSVRILGMPGEHMWDVTDVARAGGQQAMYRMRDMVMKGKPFTWTPAGLADAEGDGALPRYAKGGELSAGDKLSPLPGEGGLQPIAQLMARIIKNTWPETVSSIGGYRPPDGYNEHSSGRALDVMVNENRKTGDEVTGFSMANHPKYPVTHTIWAQKMHYPPDGRTEGMDDRGSPTQNHMDHPHIWYAPNQGPINPNVMPDNIVFGGVTDAGVRRGITAWAEKAFNTALAPVKKLLETSAFTPPPEIKAVPREMYNGMVEPAKEKLLDKVSELTSVEGWKNLLGGAVDKVRNGVGGALGGLKKMLFDTGGVIRPGTTVVQNDTGRDEYMLNPTETILLRGLVAALRGIGINPTLPQDQQTTPGTQDVNIDSVGGKQTTPGELPTPEQTEIKPPTAEELGPDTTVAKDGKQKQRTIDAVIAEGKRRGMSDDDIKAAIATVLVESEGEIHANQSVPESMNLPHTAVGSDHDSVGPFQQRNSWGTAADRMDPTKSAGLFYDALAKSGATGTIGQRAQAVQRSAFPDKYDKRVDEATAYLAKYNEAAPTGSSNDPVTVTPADPKDWETTADNVKPGDTTGSAYGQNLQGAAIGQNGEYKPDNNVTTGGKGGLGGATKPMFSNPFETDGGKFAQSMAKRTPLGIGGPQMETLAKKAPAVTELANGVAQNIPAYAAALAGNPAELAAKVATATGAWATKTATDFATYLPENAPGMIESALSAVAGPLIGTVNTGMSKDDLTSTMEDVQNRQIRRSKNGRRRI